MTKSRWRSMRENERRDIHILGFEDTETRLVLGFSDYLPEGARLNIEAWDYDDECALDLYLTDQEVEEMITILSYYLSKKRETNKEA